MMVVQTKVVPVIMEKTYMSLSDILRSESPGFSNRLEARVEAV